MYEIELRALVDGFDKTREKLDNIAEPVKLNQKEATIFFYNPSQNDFELRLRLRKNKYILSFKEALSKKARKEIESEVSNPEAVYDLLLKSGFKISMIVARVKFNYIYNEFEILLNRIIDWGDAIEVETKSDSDDNVEQIRESIREFMKSKLGIHKFLTRGNLKLMNNEYRSKIDFSSIKLQELIDYVSEAKDDINFISQKK